VAPRLRTLEIHIPNTARDGARLRLTGQGESLPGNGSRAGDLFVQLKITPHPVFRADGYDVHVEMPVAPWEAVLGGEVDVPTLDGMVKMKLPPGTQNDVKLRLHQRGLRKENGRGDEIVRVKIVIPTDLTERERHLFRQLRDISRFRPRVKSRGSQ
jgi:curved DNA-binding protein